MNAEEIKRRTKDFALRAINLVESLPKTVVAGVIGKQLLRSATSVGANYRSACRARSKADFASKICIVEEEADESAYWLELLIETEIVNAYEVTVLLKEACELTAIFAASGKTARRK